MRRCRGAVRGCVLALVIAGSTGPWGCSSPSEDLPPLQTAETGPIQVIHDLELRESADGKLEWVLRAGRAVRGASTEPTQLESLRVDFYQGTADVRSILTADSGRVDSRRGTLVARGGVVVRTPEGNRLETEELFWDRKNAQVRSDRFVRLIRGEDVLTGIGFRSDPNLDRYEILKDVRASVRESEPLRDEILEPFEADSGSDGR